MEKGDAGVSGSAVWSQTATEDWAVEDVAQLRIQLGFLEASQKTFLQDCNAQILRVKSDHDIFLQCVESRITVYEIESRNQLESLKIKLNNLEIEYSNLLQSLRNRLYNFEKNNLIAWQLMKVRLERLESRMKSNQSSARFAALALTGGQLVAAPDGSSNVTSPSHLPILTPPLQTLGNLNPNFPRFSPSLLALQPQTLISQTRPSQRTNFTPYLQTSPSQDIFPSQRVTQPRYVSLESASGRQQIKILPRPQVHSVPPVVPSIEQSIASPMKLPPYRPSNMTNLSVTQPSNCTETLSMQQTSESMQVHPATVRAPSDQQIKKSPSPPPNSSQESWPTISKSAQTPAQPEAVPPVATYAAVASKHCSWRDSTPRQQPDNTELSSQSQKESSSLIATSQSEPLESMGDLPARALGEACTKPLPSARKLLRAARSGEARVVAKMLDVGVDVDARGPGGNTALMRASGAGNAKVVKVLLRHGADQSLVSESGLTALQCAVASGSAECVQLLSDARAPLVRVDEAVGQVRHEGQRLPLEARRSWPPSHPGYANRPIRLAKPSAGTSVEQLTEPSTEHARRINENQEALMVKSNSSEYGEKTNI